MRPLTFVIEIHSNSRLVVTVANDTKPAMPNHTPTASSATATDLSAAVVRTLHIVSPFRSAAASTTVAVGGADKRAIAATPATISRYAAPANHSSVIVTYAVDHRRIFVRSAESPAAEDYLRTLLAANEAGLTGEPLASGGGGGLPERGTLVLARYEQMFYRAVVLNVSINEATGGATTVDCAYIDFGNKETLPLDALFALPATLAGRLRHPYEVQLAAVPERLCTEAAGRLLVDLVDSSRVLRLSFEAADGMLDVAGEKLRVRTHAPVRLTVPETNECINERLCALNHVEEVALGEDPLWLRELRHAPLERATDVELVVMDNSLMGYNLVSCVRRADHAQLLLSSQRFQEYCGRARGPYTPR